MNFPSCNASKCRILRCFATHPPKSVMYRILSKSGLEGKMRQISASKRSQNVVEIAKTDYCGFRRVIPIDNAKVLHAWLVLPDADKISITRYCSLYLGWDDAVNVETTRETNLSPQYTGIYQPLHSGLSQILCKHRNAVQIEQNLFKAEVAQAAAALFSK